MKSNLYRRRRSKLLLILSVVLCATLAGNSLPTDDTITLKGRFLAQAHNNLEDVGSFIGYSQLYVFESETSSGHAESVKISYTFRNIKDRLPARILNYSDLHSLVVKRDKQCDDSLEHMAYTQGFDAQGHPVDHQFTLKMAKGAPKLNISSAILPCYALSPQDFDASRSPRN